MPKMTKNAYFGPILAVFGPKILIFIGVSKSFGTNITENHLGNLSALFFGQPYDQMGQKRPYLAENASFGPNLPNQNYQTKPTKPNLPNQTYQTNLLNQTYLLNQTKYTG